MPITLHDAFVPTCRQVLGAVRDLVDRAEGWCAEQGCDASAIVEARLHETMLPFTFQIRSVAQHSFWAIEGVRAGHFSPMAGPAMPTGFADMKALIAEADAGLEAVTAEEMEGFIGKPVIFELRDMKLPFTGDQFLLSFSQPNFHFHATMAYAIMRAQGVPLGKKDYLGRMRMAM